MSSVMKENAGIMLDAVEENLAQQGYSKKYKNTPHRLRAANFQIPL